MILVVLDLVKVRQYDFCCVLVTLLSVLTRNHDFSALQPPPIRETFAVVKSRVSTSLFFIESVNFTVVTLGHVDLQRVALDRKLVSQIIP